MKGSGGDIGSMKRDGFATLYLDKLRVAEGAAIAALAHEDEMVALFDHCTFNLNPRATSIDTPLHAFVPARHVDHVHADAVIAIAASANAEELTKRDLRRRDRLSAVAAARLRSRPEARRDGDRSSRICRRGARRTRPVHLGADFEEPATRRRCASSRRRPTGSPAHEREPAFFGARHSRAVARGAPRSRGPADARDSRERYPRTSARSGISPMRPKCWNSSIRTRSAISRRSARPAPTISCAPKSVRSCCPSIPAPTISTTRSRAWTSSSRIIATSTPPITSAASVRIRPRCATPTR